MDKSRASWLNTASPKRNDLGSDKSAEWKKLMDEIIKSLRCPDDQYDPINTIEKIDPLADSPFSRPMYSYLSTEVLKVEEDMDDEEGKEQGYLISNCQRLFEYTFAECNKDMIAEKGYNVEAMQKMVMRIYDDLNLASIQNRAIAFNFEAFSKKVAKDASDEMQENIKEMQRTYISAFAVLASILFGLVGGIAFSFEGIKQGAASGSIYGLLAVISLLGSFFVAIFSSLVWLISWLANDKRNSLNRKITGNPILLPIAIALLMLTASFIFAGLDISK